MDNLDFIDFEDILDREYGPIGTPQRDKFEHRVDEFVKRRSRFLKDTSFF